MTGQYILNRFKVAVIEHDLNTWARWMQKHRTSVAQTELPGMIVSTCFLGVDHNFGEGEPLLFETMVFRFNNATGEWGKPGEVAFSGGSDQIFGFMRRYSHHGQAMIGHNQAVAGLRARFDLPVPHRPGNHNANVRRLKALWEIHYERLHTAKLEVDTRGPAEPESGSVETPSRPTRRRAKAPEEMPQAEGPSCGDPGDQPRKRGRGRVGARAGRTVDPAS